VSGSGAIQMCHDINININLKTFETLKNDVVFVVEIIKKILQIAVFAVTQFEYSRLSVNCIFQNTERIRRRLGKCCLWLQVGCLICS